MGTKAERDRQKQIQDRCQTLLAQMLRDDDNKYCVDCDAKGPRWASWNLGIFLCIRCAGIHRNLGVHISKVKSVNLDTWTPEQVVSLQQMGNSRARAVYEANLPESVRRPQTDSALEAFIRAKYEAKKYIAKEWVPTPLPKVNWDKELEEEDRARRKKRESKSGNITVAPVVKRVEVTPQPLPKPASTSPRPQRSIVPQEAAAATPTDLLGLDTPVKDAGEEDMFSGFLSAAPVSGGSTTEGASKRTQEEESFFNQSLSSPSPAASTDKKLTTDSILALYSTPSPPTFNPHHQVVGGVGASGAAMFAAPQAYNAGTFNGIVQPSPQLIPQNNMFGSVAPINIASNPFYNMTATAGAQPTFQMNKVSQDLGGLSLQESKKMWQ